MSVFDTSAVLAILYDEDGRAEAEARLADGVISTVNVAEVLGDFVASGRGDLHGAVEALENLALALESPTMEHAIRAAALKTVRNLSLGDRFCIALGESRNDRLVTSDQLWATLKLSVPIEFIR
jgi:PIN domain nuclease of toxin-antitoxin system